MRHTPSALNRGWLTILGLILLLAGIAGVLVATGALSRLGAQAGLDLSRPAPGDTVTGPVVATTMETDWAAAAVLTGGVLLGLAGLLWLIRQIPRRRLAKPFRLHDDPGTGLTRVQADVLTDAVERHLDSLNGVSSAIAQLRGTAAEPELTLRVVASDRADLPGLIGEIQTDVVAALQTALDTSLARLAVQVDIDRSPRTRSVATL